MLKELALVVAAYLLGSIPFSYIAGRLKGTDISRRGSGSVGASNVWKTASRLYAVPAGLADAGKAVTAIVLAQSLGAPLSVAVACGVATVVGHDWSLFIGFKGGRGVGASLAMAAYLSPWGLVIALALVVASLLLLHDTAPGVALGMVSLPLSTWLWGEPEEVTAAFAVLFALMIVSRLTGTRAAEDLQGEDWRRVLVNRLIYDRSRR